MGIPIGTALSLQTGLPLTIIRKRQYGLPDEITANQRTGYSEGKLYINGINKGDRILLIDDVISTGGTMEAVIDALDAVGVMICDTIIIIEKGTGAKYLNGRGYNIRTLIKIDVDVNGVNIKSN
jgi:adenine phosphoribosyltransferase